MIIHTLIDGNPVDGFTCHGLFVERDDAVQFGEHFFKEGAWSVMLIGPAYAEDLDGDNCLVRNVGASRDLLAACEAALLREDIANSELGDQLRAAVTKAGAP